MECGLVPASAEEFQDEEEGFVLLEEHVAKEEDEILLELCSLHTDIIATLGAPGNEKNGRQK